MPWYRINGMQVHVKLGGKAAKNPPAPCAARTAPDNPIVPSQRCCGISVYLCDFRLPSGATCDMPLCAEHDSGRRRYVDRPREEWQVREVPELRIVPAELWAAVRARDQQREPRPHGGAPLRTLFAGTLRCQACGGPMVAIDARRYGCNVHTDRGPGVCPNGAAFRRQHVDAALLGVVRDELLSPGALAAVHRVVREAQRAAAADGASKARAARRQALQAEIGRLVDAVAQLGLSDALRARLGAAEAALAALDAAGDAASAELLDTSAVLAAYKRQLLQLREALSDEQHRDQARTLLASLLGRVVLTRDSEGDWAEMEEPAQRVLAGSAPSTLVAGARNGGCRRLRIG